MNTTTEEKMLPHTFWGVRLSIWEVVMVIACAGTGAALGGSIYGSATVIGAAIGVLLSSGVSGYLKRRTAKKEPIQPPQTTRAFGPRV